MQSFRFFVLLTFLFSLQMEAAIFQPGPGPFARARVRRIQRQMALQAMAAQQAQAQAMAQAQAQQMKALANVNAVAAPAPMMAFPVANNQLANPQLANQFAQPQLANQFGPQPLYVNQLGPQQVVTQFPQGQLGQMAQGVPFVPILPLGPIGPFRRRLLLNQNLAAQAQAQMAMMPGQQMMGPVAQTGVVGGHGAVGAVMGPMPLQQVAQKEESKDDESKGKSRSESEHEDKFEYTACEGFDPRLADIVKSDSPKVKILKSALDGKADTRTFKFEFRDVMGAQGPNVPQVYDVDFGKPVEAQPGLKIWRGKSGENEVTYIEQGTDHVRKIFSVETSKEPRNSFFGNPGGVGQGTYYGYSVFDNMGNYAFLGSEIDSSTPPQQVYKLHGHCSGEKEDLFGLGGQPSLGNASDPVIPAGIKAAEIPSKQIDDGRLSGLPHSRSELSDPTKRKAFAQMLLEKKPADPMQAKFAQSLLDGTYQDDPAFKLKTALLGNVKFIPLEDPRGADLAKFPELKGMRLIKIQDPRQLPPEVREGITGRP